MSNIPVYKPDFYGNEKKYVNECLDTNWISSKGRFTDLFESAFQAFTSIPYCVSASNGTCALQLALAALNIPENTEIIVPSFAYVAPASAVVRHGCKPVFVDIDPNTLQIDAASIEKSITADTSCIIGVHTYGYPYDAKSVNNIAQKYKLKHIEDCAEAIGTKQKGGTHVGNDCDISTFSLYANKTITSGEGGLVCTADPSLNKKICSLKSHSTISPGIYDHDDFGFNFRLSNIACAIALGQIESIDLILEKKKGLAQAYRENVTNPLLRVFDPSPDSNQHSYWMNTVLTTSSQLQYDCMEFLKEHHIETRPLFKPIHLMEPYKIFHNDASKLINSESVHGLNLPSYPSLSSNQITEIISALNNFSLS